MAGFPRGKLISAHWNIRDPAECCTPDSPFDLSYEFCMALCVLCCSELVLEFEMDRHGLGTLPSAEPFDDTRDYPVVSPGENGLSFTTSQYGLFIPIVFGSDKLTGNVIWASQIRQNNITVDGNPFFYNSVDFALGICEGEINGVLRMWIGDKLILDNTAEVDVNGVAQPGADGFILGSVVDLTDPTSPLRGLNDAARQTKLSVFTGTETQIPEGVMVAAEGFENVPAYRGLAFVMFENFVVAEGNIPNLYVEVTANTQVLFPRVFGEVEGTEFTTPINSMMQYDPSYDRLYVIRRNVSDNTYGVATYDGNALDELSETFVLDDDDEAIYDWQYSWATSEGTLVFSRNVGNQAVIACYHPLAGVTLGTLGPGGSIAGHDLVTGFGALTSESCMLVGLGSNGLPVDIFCGIGVVNASIGFAEITPQGAIIMRSTLNGTLTDINNKSVPLYIDAAMAVNTPTFVDGAATTGTHVYLFGGRNDEPERLTITRVSIEGNGSSVTSPVQVNLPTISVDLLAGSGFGHSVRDAWLDPRDNCFVVTVIVQTRQSRIFKYNPFTGAIVWATPVNDFLVSGTGVNGGETALLTGQNYAWIDNLGDLNSIDLTTGAVEVITDSLGSQNLPTTSGARQFFNGHENALYYFSATPGEDIVKVFLNRLTRQTVELSDIISNLMKRVGLLDSDLSVDDLSELTLNGYTISSRTSLRTAFSELARVFTYDVVESNGKVKYKTRGSGPVETIHHKWLGGNGDDGWMQVRQENEASRIRKINLTYRDIDREYQQNVQSVILSKHGGHQFDEDAAIDVTVPIVLDAETARSLAEILLYGKLVYNTQYVIKLPKRYENLDPADVVRFQMDEQGADVIDVRFREMDVGPEGIDVQASQEDPDIYNDQVNLFGNVGRFEKSALPAAVRRVDPFVLQIPFRDGFEAADSSSQYYLYVTFLNSHQDMELSEDVVIIVNGTERITIPAPEEFPTWGYVIDPPLPTHSQYMTDRISELRVKIINQGSIELESVTRAELLDSDTVNLCYVAGELVQFRTAVDEGDGVWLLTDLHRSKQGTDPFVGKARRGDRFVMLADADGSIDVESVYLNTIAIGDSPRKAVQVFMNTGNPFQPNPITSYTAFNLRPWVVADIKRAFNGNDAEFSWHRRTRFDGDDTWEDAVETVPLNEITESYELYLYTDPSAFSPFEATTYLRKVEVTNTSFIYTAAMQAEDGYVNTVDDLFILAYQTGSNTGIDSGAGAVKRLQHK